MKDKRQKSGDTLKRLIKTSGNAVDKGHDLASAMMSHTAGLISKLSDDIGIMADRILAMEERIGAMADRIVRTEELMARLTATLADKRLDLAAAGSAGKTPSVPVLDLASTGVSRASPPVLLIAGDPPVYLLHVSTDARFAGDTTVTSKVASPEDLDVAWQRSLLTLADNRDRPAGPGTLPLAIAVAVGVVDQELRVSPLSNSADLTITD
jgi:hypothetical protein